MNCLFYFILGCTGSGSLFVIFATLQSQRTRILGNLHTNCHARDSRMCSAGSYKCLYNDTFNGHENSTH